MERSRLATLGDELRCQGVPAILVAGPGPSGGDADVLVRRRDVAAARGSLEIAGWRYVVGGRGLWRLLPTVAYHFDDGFGLFLHQGVPAAPLPARVMRRLERLLWERARRPDGGFLEPDPESRLLFLAVQAARPGRRQDHFREAFGRAWGDVTDMTDMSGLRDLAGAVGVRRALVWALGAKGGEPAAGPVPPLDGAWAAIAWSAARSLRRHAWPRRVRWLLEGTPTLGRAVVFTRFGGVPLLLGPGVFVPRAVSEPLVLLALEALQGKERAVVVEVGTGCGAVALAIAVSRPDAEIHAADVSARALRWARRNRRRLGADNVSFHRGSLLEPFPAALQGRVDAMVVNVPYVPPGLWGPALRDRRRAVVGRGPDGLGLHRDLVRRATGFMSPGAPLILQLAADQWEPFSKELEGLGYRPEGVAEQVAGDVIAWARAPGLRP